MITRAEILMGRDKEFPLTPSMLVNLITLLSSLNCFRAEYGKPMKVSSGYRPSRYNLTFAKNSCHLVCAACDFEDRSHELAAFCVNNVKLLEKCGLYMEDPGHTPDWVHLQIRPPPSGHRIFIP